MSNTIITTEHLQNAVLTDLKLATNTAVRRYESETEFRLVTVAFESEAAARSFRRNVNALVQRTKRKIDKKDIQATVYMCHDGQMRKVIHINTDVEEITFTTDLVSPFPEKHTVKKLPIARFLDLVAKPAVEVQAA